MSACRGTVKMTSRVWLRWEGTVGGRKGGGKNYPFGQQQAWQHRINTDLGALCRAQTFYELQLGGFGHGVRHG